MFNLVTDAYKRYSWEWKIAFMENYIDRLTFSSRHTPLETLQRPFMKNKWTQGEKTEAKVIEQIRSERLSGPSPDIQKLVKQSGG